MPSSVHDRIKKMQAVAAFQKAHPSLSWEEKAAINAYTDNQYFTLNKFLQGQKYQPSHQQALQQIADLLRSGLAKIRPYYSGTVYRGTTLSSKEIKVYSDAKKNGKPVTHSFFTSASTEEGLAFEGNVIYIIQSKRGVSVQALSAAPFENEILFNCNSSFTISDVRKGADKTYIYMEEV